MQILISFLFVTMIGMTAEAHNLIVTSEPTISGAPIPVPPTTPPGHPPVPVPTIPHFSYWKPMWDRSVAINNDFLKGDWKAIGRATTANCNQFKDESDPKGIKNDDGSDFIALNFSDVPSNSGAIFSVQLNGMGNKELNQGPYEVASAEPQFSSWSNNDSASEAWYEFSCRDSQDGNMICAIGLRTASDTSSWNPASINCLKDDYGIIIVYSRK